LLERPTTNAVGTLLCRRMANGRRTPNKVRGFVAASSKCERLRRPTHVFHVVTTAQRFNFLAILLSDAGATLWPKYPD